MQELFRFYAVRASDPAPQEDQVQLETSSAFQSALADRGATTASISHAVTSAIDSEAAIAKRELDQYRPQVQAFKARLDALMPSDDPAPVDKWVVEDFKKPLKELAAALVPNTEVLKDLLVALRVQQLIASARPTTATSAVRLGIGASSPGSPGPAASSSTTKQFVAELMLHVRVRSAIARAASASQSVSAMKRSLAMALTYDNIDRASRIIKAQLAPPIPTAPQYAAQLADLTELIMAVRAACPQQLACDPAKPGSCPYSCVKAVLLGRPKGRESFRVARPRSSTREATKTIPSTRRYRFCDPNARRLPSRPRRASA